MPWFVARAARQVHLDNAQRKRYILTTFTKSLYFEKLTPRIGSVAAKR
jgi:hypothetical protein